MHTTSGIKKSSGSFPPKGLAFNVVVVPGKVVVVTATVVVVVGDDAVVVVVCSVADGDVEDGKVAVASESADDAEHPIRVNATRLMRTDPTRVAWCVFINMDLRCHLAHHSDIIDQLIA